MAKGGRARGYRAERELVVKLWRRGFAVMRAPASGSKVKRAMYPDVVAIKRGRVAVFEVKSRSREEAIYLDRDQVEKMVEFAERAGGKAFVAIKIPGRDWIFIPVERLELTRSAYKVGREALGGGLSMEQLEVCLGLRETLERYLKNPADAERGDNVQ